MARKPAKKAATKTSRSAGSAKGSRRTRKGSDSSLPAVVYGLFLCLVAGLLALRMISDHGSIARPGLAVEGRPFIEDLKEAVTVALREEGVQSIEAVSSATMTGAPILRAEMIPAASLIRANLDVSRAVKSLRAEVMSGRIEPGGAGVDLEVGRRGEVLLRIELVHADAQAPQASLPAGTVPSVAIIIDDLGHNDGEVVEGLLALEPGLTFSILPRRPYTRALVRQCRALGREVMLHLPMEPGGYPSVDPGEMAILVEMDRETIRGIVSEALLSVGGAGVNNHMGSKATADPRVMAAVMDELAAHPGTFFIDSMTTPETTAQEVGRARGISVVRSSVFLDQDDAQESISASLDRLARVAARRGSAIGIGHPRRNTLEVLAARLESMEGSTWNLVPASTVVEAL